MAAPTKYMDLYIGDDFYVKQNVVDEHTGVAVTDATCVAQLRTATVAGVAGTAVGGQITLTHEASGLYVGTLSSTVTAGLTWATEYSIWITVSGTANSVREIKCKALWRHED